MTPRQATQYLRSFIDYEHTLHQIRAEQFKLERMERLLDAVGRPHHKLRAVHVAGSKGKGSTCAMIAQILKAAGYRVGLYTSPHIHTYFERIRILDADREPLSHSLFPDSITPEELASLLTDYQDDIDAVRDSERNGRLTFYEVFTALALLHFERRETDVVILETGLGGRLDATNAVPAKIAVITPIGLEHTHILGDTLAAIAAEKAAIIKPGQIVIVAPQQPEAMAVIEQQCAACAIHPSIINSAQIECARMDFDGQQVTMNTGTAKYPDLHIKLTGRHQQINALTALQVVEGLNREGLPVSNDAVYAGLSNVPWPIRFEVVAHRPEVILDAAHSLESLQELHKTLDALRGERRIRVVFGVSKDKNIPAMCAQIKSWAETVYLTAANHPRAHPFSSQEAEQYFTGRSVVIIPDVHRAVEQAVQESNREDIIVITGSLFVASQVRGIWKEPPVGSPELGV